MGRGKVVKKEKYKDTKERGKRKGKYLVRPDRREIKRVVFKITGMDEVEKKDTFGSPYGKLVFS